MRPVHLLFVIRVASLLALSTSLALLLDYVSPQMAFCSAASGCGKVRESGFGYIVLSSGQRFPYMPLMGMMGFAIVFSSSLQRRADRMASVLLPLCWAIALSGVVLIILQGVVIGSFCWMCLIVDACALVLGGAAVLLRGGRLEDAVAEERSEFVFEPTHLPLSESHRVVKGWQEDSVYVAAPHPTVPGGTPRTLRLSLMGWMSLLGIACGAPLLFPQVARKSDLPPVISSLYQQGVVNVVEFFDYECPHCRVALPALKAAVEESSVEVHVLARPVFLKGHPLGKVAGRVHVCAAEQGLERPASDALLAPGRLTQEMIDNAVGLPALDQQKMEECLASERPDRVLEETVARLKQADFVGLPTTYIGQERVLGAAPKEEYLAKIKNAAPGQAGSGVSGPVYWALVGALTLLVGVASRVRSRSVLEHAAKQPRA